MGNPNPCFYEDNLLLNGGFEDGLNNWTTVSGSPVVQTYAHDYNDGTEVLNATISDTISQDGFNLEIGGVYVFRAYIKFSSETARDDTSWYFSLEKAGGIEVWGFDRTLWASPQTEVYYEEILELAEPAETTPGKLTIVGPAAPESMIVDVISIGLVSPTSCEGQMLQLQTTPDELIFRARVNGPNPTPITMKVSGPCEYYDPATGCVSNCLSWTITPFTNPRITSTAMSGGVDCNVTANMPVISYDTQNLAVGEYTDTITITGDYGDPVSVPVTCYVFLEGNTGEPVDLPCLFVG